MAGEENRKIFFNDKNLEAEKGAQIFLASLPNLQDVTVVAEPRPGIDFNKRLQLLFRRERVTQGAPIAVFSLPRIYASFYLSTSASFAGC